MNHADFLESFALHERTYKYHSRIFFLEEDKLTQELNHGVQLECQRCKKSVHITQLELNSGDGELHPVKIVDPCQERHYNLCTSCLDRLLERIDLWMSLY